MINIKVENLTSYKGNKVPNQFKLNYNNEIVVFQSYDSKIAQVNLNDFTIEFTNKWDYSRTTTKYLSIFFNDLDFYELNGKANINKAILNGEVKINNHTFKVTLND